MSDTTFGPLRIWEGIEPLRVGSTDLGAFPAAETASPSLIESLAVQEILRPTFHLREPLEPLSLAWYQELEHMRYHRHGRWLPKLLEFGKYGGERLLGLGTSLGTDLVNFAAQGSEVLVASPVAEHLRLVCRNFNLRKLPGVFLHARTSSLPIESGSIDVVYVNGLLHETPEPNGLVEEIYRVLKPGGKLLAVVPAHNHLEAWFSWDPFFGRPRRRPELATGVDLGLLASGQKYYNRREISTLLRRFQEGRVFRRHLRRADVPHLCRWLPLGVLERLTGRLLLFKGLKPVSAARADLAAA